MHAAGRPVGFSGSPRPPRSRVRGLCPLLCLLQLVRENTDPAGGGADADPEKEEVSPRWHPQVRTPASTGTLRGSTCPRAGLQGSVRAPQKPGLRIPGFPRKGEAEPPGPPSCLTASMASMWAWLVPDFRGSPGRGRPLGRREGIPGVLPASALLSPGGLRGGARGVWPGEEDGRRPRSAAPARWRPRRTGKMRGPGTKAACGR